MTRRIYEPGDKVRPLGSYPGLLGLGSLNTVFLAQEGALDERPSIVRERLGDEYLVELPSGYKLRCRGGELEPWT